MASSPPRSGSTETGPPSPESPLQRHERLTRGLSVLALVLDLAADFEITVLSTTGYPTWDADGQIRVHLRHPSDAAVVADRLGLRGAVSDWDDDHHSWTGYHDGFHVALVATQVRDGDAGRVDLPAGPATATRTPPRAQA